MKALRILLMLVLLGATVRAEDGVLDPEQAAQVQFETGLRLMREKKFVSAVEAFQKATALKPDFYEAINNCGISLVQAGKQSRDPREQATRFQSATEKFSKAAELKPGEKITFMLWSETLVVLGDLLQDARGQLTCYQLAVEKVRKAVELGADDWEPYNKWAVILSMKLPPFTVNEKARLQLFLEASDLFSKSVERARFSGERGPVFANWGSALTGAARLTTDSMQRQTLLRNALDKFERSARAIPNSANTYAMWGSALIETGKASRLRADFREAIDKLNTALALRPQDPGVLYNLACAYALMDNPVMAIQNLKQCFELDTTKSARIAAASDPDLAVLRGDPSFNELLGATTGPSGVPSYNPKLSDNPR